MRTLTEPELERLALLAEECAEVQQIAMKIIRHGYDSCNPFDEDRTPNSELLNKEIAHLTVALSLLKDNDDTEADRITWHRKAKLASIQKYLHHNTV